MRDGLAAGVRSAPRLVRSLPHVVETLRYPGRDRRTARRRDPRGRHRSRRREQGMGLARAARDAGRARAAGLRVGQGRGGCIESGCPAPLRTLRLRTLAADLDSRRRAIGSAGVGSLVAFGVALRPRAGADAARAARVVRARRARPTRTAQGATRTGCVSGRRGGVRRDRGRGRRRRIRSGSSRSASRPRSGSPTTSARSHPSSDWSGRSSIGVVAGLVEPAPGRFGWLLTAVLVVVLVNAINLIDGMDGLAATVVAISARRVRAARRRRRAARARSVRRARRLSRIQPAAGPHLSRRRRFLSAWAPRWRLLAATALERARARRRGSRCRCSSRLPLADTAIAIVRRRLDRRTVARGRPQPRVRPARRSWLAHRSGVVRLRGVADRGDARRACCRGISKCSARRRWLRWLRDRRRPPQYGKMGFVAEGTPV